ncbi:tyrosine-type recombinase/integrase [Streptococcus mutans]|uniref:tyrosine-type recombinase/integrase n=1 Tax=Streptococcus mutans TaxID=1309 RepID=UPI0002B517F2|nr:site-specific integrase [Streptococcus mutans]EMC46498.1 integrase [Streptococcus mutans 24]EMP62504.1 site-specific recombinase, phage integrase family protein [Streptococcus mutans KK23]MCB4971001.1 site-specific integrase [Streptococcus mutans]MCB4972847.1 site-specific integrase [Streptococcus mutans]NLQ41310.1 site-specific integrase [Streptococcus mutans]
MVKTNFQDVYIDNKGQFYYELSLGNDKITGKRIKKKARKSAAGKKFSSAKEAYIEAIRVKNEYLQSNGYSNYDMTYEQFMQNTYLPYYKSEVSTHTYSTRQPALRLLIRRFGKKKLTTISIRDVQNFRTWLLSEKGANYSQAYASLTFGTFRKSLEFAVSMQYLTTNISMKVKAIPKGKTITGYWTKQDFEKVISNICINDFYEHLCFVLLWLYFCTGVRVNEGTALWRDDINFSKKELHIGHMMIISSKTNWIRQSHTKTDSGLRTISLDDDTICILREWKKRQSKLGKVNFILSYDSNPMLKSTISRIIKRYARIAGVPKIQAKGLRHSHASYLINELNASVLIVSKRLGHSSPEITLRHYAHLWSGVDKELASEMAGLINIKHAEKTQIQFNGNQALLR